MRMVGGGLGEASSGLDVDEDGERKLRSKFAPSHAFRLRAC